MQAEVETIKEIEINDNPYSLSHEMVESARHSLSTVHEGESSSLGSEQISNRQNSSYRKYSRSNQKLNDLVTSEIDDRSADELEITDDSINYRPYVRSQIELPVKHTNHTIDKTVKHYSIINTSERKRIHKPHKTKEYLLSVSPRPNPLRMIQPFDTRNYSNYVYKREHKHSHETNPNVTYEYWTIPRNSSTHYKPFGALHDQYLTPNSLFVDRNDKVRLKRKSHKHSKEKNYRELIKLKEQQNLINDSENEQTNSQTNLNGTEKQQNELKVYFRFARGTLSDPYNLNFIENHELLVHFQAACRGWLTRSKWNKNKNEEIAVRCIQKNANLWFNPWFRLMLALRPLIKTQRVEEELLFLRSEIERYKAMIMMLRFENAEYQARVANLVQLLEQLNTSGSNSTSVQTLVDQISDALSKNQEFWETMAKDNKTLLALQPQKPEGMIDSEPTIPNPENSPITKLKRDAEFYRDQVELLREEADEQQLRSAEHYRNQVCTLSERVEQLQHILALESSKVERLNSELEERNTSENESKSYVRNLEQMVNQLSKQLEQRSKTPIALTPRAENGLENQTDLTIEQESVIDLQNELNNYRSAFGKLKDYVSSHPELAAQLETIPLKMNGELEISSPLILRKSAKLTGSQQPLHFFTPPATPNRDESAETAARIQATLEITELKKQLGALQQELIDSEERVKYELENREELENENYRLRDHSAVVDMKLRQVRDEYDELYKKELTHQRQYKDLQDQLDDEMKKVNKLTQQNKELEQQLEELRECTEPEEDLLTKEWESMKSKLRADVMFYKNSLDQLREEYDQFRLENDPATIQRQLTEKEEKLTTLEKEKQQWRLDLDILNVKLQNTTSLLEKNEATLKVLNRERVAQVHRISQLENERDKAIREAASVSGRASADRELAIAKIREIEELRNERDMLRKELGEVKQSLAGSTAENSAEKRQLQARLREMEQHNEARIADLKGELERIRDEREQLQMEFQTLQSSETELRATNRQYKRRIDELEDQIGQYTRRITGLERQSTDLDAELTKAKADLTATRETIKLRRANNTRMADEWMNNTLSSAADEDTDDESNITTPTRRFTKLDDSTDLLSDDSVHLSRTSLRGRTNQMDKSGKNYENMYRSIPNLTSRYPEDRILSSERFQSKLAPIYSNNLLDTRIKTQSLSQINPNKYLKSDTKLRQNNRRIYETENDQGDNEA